MHPQRLASCTTRRLLLASVCMLAFAAQSQARSLMPEQPSVEVNLGALQYLQASAPPVFMAPAAPRMTPSQQPAAVPGAPYAAATPPAAPTRKAKPARRRAPVAQPKPAPVAPAVVAAPAPVPAPAPAAVANPLPSEALPSLPPPPPPVMAVPAPAAEPVALPKVASVSPVVEPPSTPPAPVAPPVVAPKEKPAAKPTVKTIPVPDAVPAPVAPAPAMVEPLPELPKITPPAMPAPAIVPNKTPAAEKKPPAPEKKPAAAVAPLPPAVTPAMPDLPPPLEPSPPSVPASSNAVVVPKLSTIRQAPPAPDISGLNFAKLPGEQAPAAQVAVPTTKPVAAAAPVPEPVNIPTPAEATPVAPTSMPVTPAAKPSLLPPRDDKPKPSVLPPALPDAPVVPPATLPDKPVARSEDVAPLMVPVPKSPPPLPPTVTERLDAMNQAPKTYGMVSDNTSYKGATPEKQAQWKKSAEAMKADADAKTKAKAEADAKAAQDARLKAETQAAAERARAEKANADAAAAAKKAAEKAVPSVLPPPPVDPLAKPKEMVKLESTKIAALPAVNSKAVVERAPEAAQATAAVTLPKAPTPPLPVLPGLEGPASASDLPSLESITGGEAPSSMDVVLPRDGVTATNLPAPGAPSLPLPPLGEAEDLPIAKRTLPEVSTASKQTINSPGKVEPAAVVAKAAVALPNAAEATVADSKTPIVVATAAPAPKTGALRDTLRFAPKQATLSDEAKASLGNVAASAIKSGQTIRIVGYAPGTPEEASSARVLSNQRALAVRAYLLSKGVNTLAISAQSFGNQKNDDTVEVYVK